MSHVLSSSYQSSFAKQTWCVLKAWIRDPSKVASVCPSSRFLTEQLADRTCIREAARVIELGPGAGRTTEALLNRMPRDSKLLAVEKIEAFAEVLHQIDDSRLSVCIADACDLVPLVVQQAYGQADVVVSGVPFSYLSTTIAKQITQSIYEVLRPGGVFIAYQLRSDVQEYARPLFGQAQTEHITMNLPPLRAFIWEKSSNGKSL